MKRSISFSRTALAVSVVPINDIDTPAADDEWIQRISGDTGYTCESIAQLCAEVFASILIKTGCRPALEDVVAAVEVTMHEKRPK